MIKIDEATIDEAYTVHREIPEFIDPDDTLLNFRKRIEDKNHLIIVGYLNDKPAGYLIGYDRWKDGSFYCWMAAVKERYRSKGVLKSMMEYQYQWAAKHGYKSIKIKTRNSRREMLAYLVKYGFCFLGVDTQPNIMENRIALEKQLYL